MASRSGHRYSNIYNSDSSRNHLGDVYNQYGPSPDQQAFRAVLDSLRYDGMDDRRDRLNSAERGTFEWALHSGDDELSTDSKDDEGYTADEEFEEILEDSLRRNFAVEYPLWHRTKTIGEAFTNWLVSDEEECNLFCFMGKPGSGKSTLMKFLSANPEVDQFLGMWTAGHVLIQAEHFFWIMGGAVQKTRVGLLRHLLYSALLSLPADNLDFAKRVCGSRRLSSHNQRAWSYEELWDMLVHLVSFSKAKFFFLVDALDECNPQDLHGELADEMTKISQLPNVKLCVSCRPWKPFVSKFKHDQTLHLDKMTYRDMKIYIRNRLANADGENDLCSEFRSTGITERAKKFMVGLACGAEGVFLWTELVVQALSSELRKGCGFEQLEKALSEFPIGLDEYFEKLVFDRITRTRQNSSDTAAALTLALKIAETDLPWDSLHSRSFINFWLLGNGQLAAGFSWADHSEEHYSREDFDHMVKLTTNFVQETCKDLLVVVKNIYTQQSWDVEFLHRTVSDFLCDDRMRHIIERKSPDHFKNANFVVDLGKLRSLCLLSQAWDSCLEAEETFARAIDSTELSAQFDRAWLSRCEALMIKVHQRMQVTGICHRFHHHTTWIHPYIVAGLSEYLLALIVLWPCLAFRSSPQLMIETTDYDSLEGFLWGWLALAFSKTDFGLRNRTATCGLRSISSSWGNVASSKDVSTCSQHCFSTHLQFPFDCLSGDRHIRLFHYLLSCGKDPNRRIGGQFLGPVQLECKHSVWQDWLRAVSLKLQTENNRHTAGFDSISSNIKDKVGDIVAVFLWHGADPTCHICVSDHHHDEPCRLEPLESVLASITSHDHLSQLQALLTRYSTRFDRRVVKFDRMLRAMRSWTASRRTAGNSDEYKDQRDSSKFLLAFVENSGGFLCDCCSESDTLFGFASAFCLDCTGGYYMCRHSAQRHYPDVPTADDVSRHLVHERLSSEHPHLYIWFGERMSSDPGINLIRYGVESSMSVLEDWYARGTNGEDATLE